MKVFTLLKSACYHTDEAMTKKLICAIEINFFLCLQTSLSKDIKATLTLTSDGQS